MFEQCTSVHDVLKASIGPKNSGSKDWTVKLRAGKTDLLLEIDSGAQCNVLSRTMAKKFGSVAQIRKKVMHA